MSDKLDRFTQPARQALTRAQEETLRLNHSAIGPEHMLLALARDERGTVSQIFRELQVDTSQIIRGVEHAVARSEYRPTERPGLAQGAKRLIEYAVDEARTLGHHTIGTEHLLLGLLRVGSAGEDEGVALRVLEALDLSAERIRLQVLRKVLTAPAREQVELPAETQPDLDDLTAAAEAGRLDPLIGRQCELERLIQILGRHTRQNALLVGELGVGKRALVHGLAQRMAAGDVPAALLNRRLILLELKGPGRSAAAHYLLQQSRKMAESLSAGAILVVDPAHKLVDEGRSFVWTYEILSSLLDKNTHQIIGVTTPAAYQRYLQGEEAKAWGFQSLEISEPSPEETIAILRGIKGRYETHHRVRYTDETLAAAVQLAVQHIPGRFLPDKALDLIDEAGSRVRIQHDLDDPALRAHFLTLQQVRAHKAAALDAGEMSKALALRQRELTLTDELDDLRADSARTADPPPVTPQDVAGALALWTERSSRGPKEPPQ